MSHHRPSEFVTAHLLLAREIIGGDIEPETTLKIDCENASPVIKQKFRPRSISVRGLSAISLYNLYACVKKLNVLLTGNVVQ